MKMYGASLVMAGLMMAGSAGVPAQQGGNGSVLLHDEGRGAQESDSNAYRVSAGVMEGLNTYKADAPYPEQARRARVSGAVVLAVKIDRDGKVAKATVISGPVLLRDAAKESVQKWTYKPYVLNGKAVAVQTTVTVNFYLPA